MKVLPNKDFDLILNKITGNDDFPSNAISFSIDKRLNSSKKLSFFLFQIHFDTRFDDNLAFHYSLCNPYRVDSKFKSFGL